MRKFVVSIVILVSASLSGVQQTGAPDKIKISVTNTSKDDVGRQFAYAIREELRKSAKYILIEDGGSTPYSISLVTIDPDIGGRGSQLMTVGAITMSAVNPAPFFLLGKIDDKLLGNPLFNLPLFVTTWIQTVGRDRIESSARSIVADVDEQVIKLRQAVK